MIGGEVFHLAEPRVENEHSNRLVQRKILQVGQQLFVGFYLVGGGSVKRVNQ